MKLLDRIAKRLGYVPDNTLIQPIIIQQHLSIETLGAYCTIPGYELVYGNKAADDMLDIGKKRIIEMMSNDLMTHTYFKEETIGSDLRITGRIQVVTGRK